jgi:hypothetical protein
VHAGQNSKLNLSAHRLRPLSQLPPDIPATHSHTPDRASSVPLAAPSPDIPFDAAGHFLALRSSYRRGRRCFPLVQY